VTPSRSPHWSGREKDVKAKSTEVLHRQAQIDARRVWLTTEDGHVTLHGQVSSWNEAEAARKSAASDPGVTEVESKLTVTP
jgi:osmotically-inducible protein OsmY